MSDDRSADTHDHAGDDVRAARERERTTDAVDREATSSARKREAQDGVPSDEQRADAGPGPATGEGSGGDGDDESGDGGGGRSGRIAFWLSALFGLALAVGAAAFVTGRAPFFEDVMRVRPTIEGGGVGADWVVGNTGPILEAAITLVHLADVVMGIFILLMVFIHWAAFRRLATRMRPPAGSSRARESAAATDGGEPNAVRRTPEDGESFGSERSAGPRSSSDRRSDVGEPNAARRTPEDGKSGDGGGDHR
ncbi:hypothetical protein Htur_2350 [Haloterrigena turkmenica DSM 5511]|uniref:Uncharacterized protein n=1 Tax=Haloterrigena turkmenica (strain ATCC 51198 / DSM 5511 / JCM 9101 / NCIMB 13204 / VKM B-1734 / 4k) TaxID=543526 RepID=D2RUQ6_HALTV|nr:hypothetical protein [Haloterrigena turkmenica]ADB61228.1 hypothetical protein Htur_2350 [Haloterrigena turkmenica DSM 5511]